MTTGHEDGIADGIADGTAPDGAAASRYHFSYGPHTPYAHAVALVSRWRLPEGEVVVDLGCGFGAIAEPVADLGLTYLGVDVEEAGLASLRERGAEAITGDLGTPEGLFGALTEALAGRRVAAFGALDAVEHLPRASDFLVALSLFAAGAHTGAPLVVSIPNVSHRDLAAKLLLGRWDVTPTGLLDETHVRFFSPATLDATMHTTGWETLDAHDFFLEESDQHFPPDSVALAGGTPLGSLLRAVRASAAPGATTNQFVRAYRPVPVDRRRSARATEPDRGGAPAGPWLSAVVRTAHAASRDAPLEVTLRALAAQEMPGLEVVVVSATAPGGAGSHGTRDRAEDPGGAAARAVERMLDELGLRGRELSVPPADEGRWDAQAADAGAQAATGRYVAFFGAGDVPPPAWSRQVADAGARAPGAVVVVGEPGARTDLASLLARPPGPAAGTAFPRSVFCDLGLRVSDHLPACAEWHLLLHAVGYCGAVGAGDGAPVHVAPAATGPGGQGGQGAHDGSDRLHEQVLAMLDAEPLLLGRGSASLLAWLATAERARADAEARAAAMEGSTSWRVTAPLRAATAWWRAGRRR